MEDNRWLRLIIAGLILAAIAVGYLILTNRFNTAPKTPQQTRPVQQASPTPSPTPSPSTLGTSTSTDSANLSGATTLPNTGFPAGLAAIFSLSALVSGYFLRKYPK